MNAGRIRNPAYPPGLRIQNASRTKVRKRIRRKLRNRADRSHDGTRPLPTSASNKDGLGTLRSRRRLLQFDSLRVGVYSAAGQIRLRWFRRIRSPSVLDARPGTLGLDELRTIDRLL